MGAGKSDRRDKNPNLSIQKKPFLFYMVKTLKAWGEKEKKKKKRKVFRTFFLSVKSGLIMLRFIGQMQKVLVPKVVCSLGSLPLSFQMSFTKSRSHRVSYFCFVGKE